jgi:hypothetical protein
MNHPAGFGTPGNKLVEARGEEKIAQVIGVGVVVPLQHTPKSTITLNEMAIFTYHADDHRIHVPETG